jgi:prefoldin subunit 5
MGTIIGMGLAALVAAVGSGISASASSRDAKKMSRAQRQQIEKQRKQEKFQFGYTALAQQRQAASQTARRRIFNRDILQLANAPKTSTF